MFIDVLRKRLNQLSDSRQSIPVEQDNLFRMDRQTVTKTENREQRTVRKVK